jgi:hypothetical protein
MISMRKQISPVGEIFLTIANKPTGVKSFQGSFAQGSSPDLKVKIGGKMDYPIWPTFLFGDFLPNPA